MQLLIGYFLLAAAMVIGAWLSYKRTENQIVESMSLMVGSAAYIAWNVTCFRDFTAEIVAAFFVMGCAGLAKCVAARHSAAAVPAV